MRKVVLYIAASLDNYIAKPDGNIDWLHAPEYSLPDEDYGYSKFYKSIDITLMGYKTYEETLGFGIPFPYMDKVNYVFTRSDRVKKDYVQFVNGEVVSFTEKLKNSKGKDIWLVGGGEINSLFLEHGLIDRIILTLIPITLGKGLPLFPVHSKEIKFNLVHTEAFKSGLCQITYDRK